MGDFIGATGELFITRHGQLTLLVDSWTFLGKTLKATSRKMARNSRSRRYLSLSLLGFADEPGQHGPLFYCTRFTSFGARDLDQHAFIEVETPVLASKASGATARPFARTTMLWILMYICALRRKPTSSAVLWEALNEFMSLPDVSAMKAWTLPLAGVHDAGILRCLLELRGQHAVYRRSFDARHPNAFGTLKVQILSRNGESVEVDFTGPWPRVDFATLIKEDSGIDIWEYNEDVEGLRKSHQSQKLDIEDIDTMGCGNLCDALYKKVSRPKLIQPVFCRQSSSQHQAFGSP